MHTGGPAVTVAVVSWNTRQALRGCLTALAPDAAEGLARVVVCDNASEDGSAEMVAAEFPWVNLCESGSNPGFGAAVNAVAADSLSPWIAAANADVFVEPAALHALLRAGKGDGVGAVAPRLVRDGVTEASVHRFPTLVGTGYLYSGLDHALHRLGGPFESEHQWDPAQPREVDWAHGAFLLVRRSAFDEVGGFDESQWLFHEDLDICWRLRRAGWKVLYEPRASVGHIGGAAVTQALGADRERQEVATLYRWIAVRRGWRVERAYALLNLAGILPRLLVLAILSPLRAPGLQARRRLWRSRWRHHRQGLGPRERILSYR